MSTEEKAPITVEETVTKATEETAKSENQSTEVNAEKPTEDGQAKEEELNSFPINIKTCGEKKTTIQLQVSPLDNVQDIKQYLFESIDTCYITNYHLFLDGTKLNDFAEINDVKGLVPESTLEMKEARYDERSIRLHVRRLREILISSDPSTSPTVFSSISKEDSAEGKEEIKETDTPVELGNSLANYYPPSSSNATISCLKSIVYSGWNPPPGNRKLSGDLIYLEVTTLEDKKFSITGWTKGFYVNSTVGTNFNPNPSDKPFHAHSIVSVLNQLSAGFKKNFVTLLTTAFQKHPFEMFPVPFPITPWVAKKEKHSFDLNRAEDSLLFASEIDVMRGQLRDWNEEYQSCKELPRETIQERIVRDRALVKVNCDFVESATKGACAIIEKTVPPINPLDPEKAHMFLYNNIFFSFAMDGRDLYKEFGGDKAAYVSVNNDLKGTKLFNRIDVKGLYTLATAIIDYRGYRVVAQSIIPGILQREQTSNVVYGSIDNGKSIVSESAFHELMCSAGKLLHVREHTVIDAEGKELKLCSPIEAKGIIGTDSRKYILDLVRTAPRDSLYPGKTNTYTILRPELVDTYFENLRQQDKMKKDVEKAVEKEKAKQLKASEEKKEVPEKQEEIKEGKQEVPEPTEKPKEGSEEKEKEKEEEEQEEEEPAVEYKGLNPNVFCDFKLGGTPEEIEEDQKRVEELSAFLMETMIPTMIDDFAWLVGIPVDGQTLTTVMHGHGINMRYLGIVARFADKIAIAKELAIREMITRATKHILREILRETEDFNLANVLSHFLNCLIGDAKSKNGESTGTVKKGKKKTSPSEPLEPIKNVFSLSASKLWPHVVSEVQQRFKYDLPERDSVKSIIRSVQTLRSICQKVGIQVEAKDYNLNLDAPFQPSDILNLFPVVKHCDPESSDGHGLLDAGKTFLAQGRLDIAYELLTEALAIFHQVYGLMHRDTANCYGNLATVLYHAKDMVQALDYQQKATIINERVLGLDHHDTLHSYANLAMFCHSTGKHKIALNFMYRSLYLDRLVSGPLHPDTAATYLSLCGMLQETGQHKSTIAYLLEALKCYEGLFGPNNLQTAIIYHSIAIAYGQLGQFKDALNFEKKNYAILHEQVGDADLRTVESNICLKQFTAKAVQVQIETKKTQRDITAQLSQVKLDKIRSSVNLPGKGGSLSSSGVLNPTLPMGNRPLTEVMSFINGSKSSVGKSFVERNKKVPLATPITTTTTTTSSSTPPVASTSTVSQNANVQSVSSIAEKTKKKKKTVAKKEKESTN